MKELSRFRHDLLNSRGIVRLGHPGPPDLPKLSLASPDEQTDNDNHQGCNRSTDLEKTFHDSAERSGRPGQWLSIANRDEIPALPAASFDDSALTRL